LFGSLIGALGIALALPLFAVGRIAVLRLYVEDWLGDDRSALSESIGNKSASGSSTGV
jgi:hypothetical protein